MTTMALTVEQAAALWQAALCGTSAARAPVRAQLGEFAIYPVALTAEQVAAHWQASTG